MTHSSGKTHSNAKIANQLWLDIGDPYLNMLLKADRKSASKFILDAVENSVAVQDIYLHVFQPSQHKIGELWQTNQVTVAQEHYCTAATQLIMSQLYHHIFNTKKIGRTMLATCVGNELHEIGIRMVADFFEMAGWDTYYIGANSPKETILTTLATQKADLLAISATMTFHINEVIDLIGTIKEKGLDEIEILVGGRPFNIDPNLWQAVGADGFARDAQDAVYTANHWYTNRN